MSSHWTFSASPSVTAITLAAWIACVWLALLQWRRRGGGTSLAAIEGTRLLAVTLVCFALFKPEIVQEIPHTEQPKVVILRDVSGSMATQDVRTPDGGVQTRAEWLAANATPGRWKPLATKGQLAVEDFGAPPPAAGPRGGGEDAPRAPVTPGPLNDAGRAVAAMDGWPPLALAATAGLRTASCTCCVCMAVGGV